MSFFLDCEVVFPENISTSVPNCWFMTIICITTRMSLTPFPNRNTEAASLSFAFPVNITDVIVTSHAIILFARSADSLNSCHHKLLDLYLLIPIRVLNRRISPYNWISETPLDVPLLSNDLLQVLKHYYNSQHNLSQTGHQCHLVLHLIDRWPVISVLDCFAHALPYANPWKPWCCGDLGECPNDGLKVILHSL